MQEILDVAKSDNIIKNSAKKSGKSDADAGQFSNELEIANKELVNAKEQPSNDKKTPLTLKEATALLQKETQAAKNALKPVQKGTKLSSEAAGNLKDLLTNGQINTDAARKIFNKNTQNPLNKLANDILNDKNLAQIINNFNENQTNLNKNVKLLDLSKALQLGENSKLNELKSELKTLEKLINKALIKLDKKLEKTAQTIAKSPEILKDFLNFEQNKSAKVKELIQNAQNVNQILPKRLQISKEELLESIKIELAQHKDYGSELLNDLTFTKLLDFAQSLKLGEKTPDFSGLFKLNLSHEKSLELSKMAKNASNVKELLNNLKDQLQISKLTFERVQNEQYNPQIFASSFSKLYEDGFFATRLAATLQSQSAQSSVKKLLNEGAKNNAKVALNTDKIDLSALKSGKLNELLGAAKEQIAQLEAKFSAKAAHSGASVATKSSEQMPQDASTAANSKLLAAGENDGDSSLFRADLSAKDSAPLDKHALKTAFVSGQNLNKEQTRTMIENFAQDFKDEIAKFKAPLHRVSIALKPAELGEINVTMMARGNNLQVNLQTANANTMNIFVQNQSEIRTALVNMGFTGLSMNFSSGGEQQRQQHEQRQGKSRALNDDERENIDAPSGINFTIERYL